MNNGTNCLKHSTPKVTVIFPVGSKSKFLGSSLKSVLCQSEKNLEIIVIQNCVTFDILKFLSPYKDSRITVIFATDKKSAAYARNEGLKIAKGEFIAICDAGDEMKTNHLKEAIETLQVSQADFYFCGYSNRSAQTNRETVRLPNKDVTKFELLTYNPIGHSTVVMRASLKPVYPNIPKRHDVDLWLKFYQAGVKFTYSKSVNVYRNLEKSSLSYQKSKQLNANWYVCKKYSNGIFQASYYFAILILRHMSVHFRSKVGL